MSNLRAALVIVCAGALAACSSAESAEPDLSHADIANIKTVRSDLPAPFKVTDIAPTAIDPRILEPQKLPPEIKFDPADCGQFANQQVLPAGVKGNMAALTAEGEGNRFIVIAVETSETGAGQPTPRRTARRSASPGRRCAASSRSSRRRRSTALQTLGVSPRPADRRSTASRAPASSTTTSRSFGSLLVIVTANPLVRARQAGGAGRHPARPRPAQSPGVAAVRAELNARRAAGTGC